MEIHYCDKCKARIPEADVTMGLAFVDEDGTVYCPLCWQQLQDKSRRSGPYQTVLPEEAQQEEVIKQERPARPSTPSSARQKPRTQRIKKMMTPSPRPGALGRRKRSSGALVLSVVAGFAIAVIAAANLVPRWLGAGNGAKKPGAESKNGAKNPGPQREDPPGPGSDKVIENQGSSRDEIAGKAFEEIAKLVEAGSLAEAQEALEDSLGDLADTEYQEKAGDLIAKAIEARDKRTLEEEADALCKELDALFGGEKYARVVARVDEVGTKYAETSYGPKLVSLRDRAERARQEQEEAELRKRQAQEAYDDLLAAARRKVKAGEFEAALKLLEETPAEMDTPDIRAEIKRVSFKMYVQRGRRLAEAGRIDAAIAAYGKAMEIRRDPEVAEEAALLSKAGRFNELRQLAEKQVAQGNGKAAVETYEEAKELAPDEESRRLVESALLDLRLAAALVEAEGHLREGKWRAAERAASEALQLKPDTKEARAVLVRARGELLPRELRHPSGIEFVLVREGGFTMGTDDGPAEERPAHEVWLSAYYIGRTEVTNVQYESRVPRHRRRRGGESPGDEHPAVNVTYEETLNFCDLLSEEGNVEYRLPTEAEWERAARGLDGRAYPWGEEPPAGRGTYRCNFRMRARKGAARDGFLYTAPVGSFSEWASPVGCLDMAGNVSEWCLDWFERDRYEKSGRKYPVGSSEGTRRVVRGGSWKSAASAVRATARSGMAPREKSPAVGFRVVRRVEIPTSAGEFSLE